MKQKVPQNVLHKMIHQVKHKFIKSDKLQKWFSGFVYIRGIKISVRILSLELFLLLILTVLLTLFSGSLFGKTKLTVFSGDGFCITDNRVTDEMLADEGKRKPGNLTKTRSFPAESKLYKKADEYFIYPSNKEKEYEINSEYPVFLNNGAYLYIYSNKFDMVYSNMTSGQSEANTFIGGGSLFDNNMKKKNSDNIVLLQLPNKLFVNALEIKIETQNKSELITPNSILRLQEGEISCINLADKKSEIKRIKMIQGISMIVFGDKKYTYDVFYGLLNQENSEMEKQDTIINEYHLTDDIYQHFMGRRYDYKGEKVFYRSKDGFLMQNEGEKFPVYSMPLYFSNSKKLLLPCDYVIVEPKAFTMKKQPAMSEVYADNMAVYTKIGDKLRTYTDLFLFDGQASYVFMGDTSISIGNIKVNVSAFANVNVADDGSVEIYDYMMDEYKSFSSQGYKNVYAEMKDGTKIDICKDVLYLPGAKEQILFSEPSKLEEAK